MICSKCVEEGTKSRITPGIGSSTCMYCAPFYDEEGVYHNHDYNTIRYTYSCSEGHYWTESRNTQCPNCDFGKDSSKITFFDKPSFI